MNSAKGSQQVRFCTSRDGARIAYASRGSGPPLIWLPHWAHHLRFDGENPVWGPWLSFLTRHRQVLYYDWRGCGLSDRQVEFSFECYAADLEAVIASTGLNRFILFGMASGADVALDYAARNPDRVTHLILYACKLQGALADDPTPAQVEEAEARLKVVELGWPDKKPAYGQFFTSLHLPDATSAQIRAYNELLRLTTCPENVRALIRSFWRFDIRGAPQAVRCPTLVLHARQDSIIPFEAGRSVAALVPGALFVPLESRDHILVDSEPAWRQLVEAIESFLPTGISSPVELSGLTPRERDVLEVLAKGRNNAQIAAQLQVKEKTVRNIVSSLFSKLGVSNRAEAVARARDAGLGSETPRQ
jgi:pimeloyl-ACP methyl ester carboxylesterase/DNA-binding CsgD family transcriptional regulator